MSDGLPDPNDPEDRVDQAFAAYLRLCDSGENTTREEFLAQFPEIADQLSELMEAADLMGQATFSSFGIDPLDGPAGQRERERREVGLPAMSEDPSTYASSDIDAHPGAETVTSLGPVDDGSDPDSAITLPMSHRAQGDSGPSLPYDLGDYLLIDVVGRGGMGVVYRARQYELDRLVAVKMIRSGMLASEAEVRRFYTEAQAAARLHHPGIVSVFQFGRRAGHHFFSMEFVSGTDLQRRLSKDLLPPHDAARYVRDVARAIDHAHEKGVLHRDLKPANVLIDERDQVHVTDFGLAKHLDCDSSVTASGDAVGTPHYMAPEQAGGQSDLATVQSDVYSLGAILFAALTGRPPLVGDTVMQTLVKVVHDPAPPVRSLRRDAPADLETIISKCLEKKSAKRYVSAGQLADDLDAYLEGRPITARPRSAAMRTWHWIEGVPLVGALMGRRVLHSSASHRRFQAALLLGVCLVPFALVTLSTIHRKRQNEMPELVRFAGGIKGGTYTALSTELAKRIQDGFQVKTQVQMSKGSIDNHDQLINRKIDLAPMQATAIRGDHLRVVAPLFHELLHVLVRADSGIERLTDLRGHSVAVGPQGSGSQATAELVLESLGLDAQTVIRESGDWSQLHDEQTPDVAMICIGQGSQLVIELLESRRWRLIPIDRGIEIALEHPTLRPMRISISQLQGTDSLGTEIATVGTTAFLAARDDAPADLVRGMLEALYQEPLPKLNLISRRHAAEWQGLAFHHAARRFYSETSK